MPPVTSIISDLQKTKLCCLPDLAAVWDVKVPVAHYPVLSVSLVNYLETGKIFVPCAAILLLNLKKLWALWTVRRLRKNIEPKKPVV